MTTAALEYYAEPGRFTRLSPPSPVAAGADISQVVAVVQGLLVYDTVAEPMYGATLSPAQAETIHERDTEPVLEALRSVDSAPLDQPREPQQRVGARCHLYSRLTVALLRSVGVPARARCGFGAAFNPGWFEDHWVAEYWNAEAGRWCMVDAQLDATWREAIGFAGDPLDLTPDEFVTGGRAWQAWRRGELDADRCGLTMIDEHGAFWIASNLRLDLASLNKVEMLPWDVWGAGLDEESDEPPADELLALFDRTAELTVDPDATFDEMRSWYESTDDLRMTGTVFSAAKGETEQV